MKLTTRIITAVIIVALLGVGGVVYYFTSSVRNILQEAIADNQIQITKTAIAEIDSILYERLTNIQMIAGSAAAVNVSEGEVSDIASQGYLAVLDHFTNFTGPWDELMIINLTGEVAYCSSGEDYETETIYDKPEISYAYNQALSGKNYYSDLVISSENKKPTIIFAVPIRDTQSFDSPIVGVAIGQFVWLSVLERLEEYSSDYFIGLYNKDGYLIGSNDRDYYKDILKTKSISTDSAVYRSLNSTTPGAMIMNSVFGDEETLSAFVQESGYLNFQGNNWSLISEVPTREAFSSVNNVAWGLVYVLVVAAVVSSVFFLIILFFFLIKPIKELTKTAQDISHGDFSAKVNINSNDEIGHLAKTFNFMSDQLKDLYGNLETKVKKQTEELNKKVNEIETKKDNLEQSEKAMLNILEDVEEEKAKLSFEKDKVNAILYSIGDGVFVVDKNLKILVFNDVAANISGYSREEAMGKKYDKILNFVFEDDNKVNDAFLKQAMKTGMIKEMANHTVLVRKDGKKVPVADSAAPLKDKDGQVIGCVVVFRDVTKERQIDQAKSEFVSLASHQLRTPLSTIRWYLELLLTGEAGKLTPDQRQYLQEAFDSNKRLIDLVNGLLNVSRIDLGTFMVSPGKVDIIMVAEDVLKDLKPEIDSKEMKITKEFSPDIPVMNLDPKLTSIILQNLLTNAVKYTPSRGQISLTIGKDEKNIKIAVKDNGYGIPKAQQDKIFNKLFRADNIRKKDTEGTGLGLYVVKAIVEQNGGKIWFESEENKGTTFFVELPISGMKKKQGTKDLMPS